MDRGRYAHLMAALGAWLEADPVAANADERHAASRLILSGRLLGVGTLDLDAPELGDLTESDLAVLDQVRAWAYPDGAVVDDSRSGSASVDRDPEGADVGADAVLHVAAKERGSDVRREPVAPQADVDASLKDRASAVVGRPRRVSDVAEEPVLAPLSSEVVGRPRSVSDVAEEPLPAPSLSEVVEARVSDPASASSREKPLPIDLDEEPRTGTASALRRPGWLTEEVVLMAICAVAIVVLVVRRIL